MVRPRSPIPRWLVWLFVVGGVLLIAEALPSTRPGHRAPLVIFLGPAVLLLFARLFWRRRR